MTLIFVGANPHFAFQVSDRRLTATSPGSPTSSVVTDESGKSLLWFAQDARFIVGYTGITFSDPTRGTLGLLAELISELYVRHGHDVLQVLDALPDALTKAIKRKFRDIPAASRRLTVMITGFIDEVEGMKVMPCQGLITNFQEWGESDSQSAWPAFKGTSFRPTREVEWPTIVQRIGQWATNSQQDAEEIRALLARGKPPRASVGWVVDRFPGFASKAANTVGPQLNSVVLYAMPPARFYSKYHSSVVSSTDYGISQVHTYPDQQISLLDPQISVEGDGPPLVVPTSRKNALCRCGSGSRYRDCHGREHSSRIK